MNLLSNFVEFNRLQRKIYNMLVNHVVDDLKTETSLTQAECRHN